ncbi:hypothetical protein D1872_350690 [compost metagenome]
MATHQNNTGTITYAISIRLFIVSGLYTWTRKPLYWLPKILVTATRNNTQNEMINVNFWLRSYFRSQ